MIGSLLIAPVRRVLGPCWRWLLLSLGIVTVPFVGLLVGADGALAGDVPMYHLPVYTRSWESILSGDSPFWGNWVQAGQNVIGTGQAGIFYPFNAVFGAIDPTVGLRWWIVLHILIGTTGAFLWSWRSWRSGPAATVTAIAYGLNGFFILHLVHMNFTVVSAWLPWVFLGSELVGDRWSLRRAAVFVFPLAFIAVSGAPQLLWITFIGLGIYSAIRLSARGVGVWPWFRIGLAGAIALGIASVQLLPVQMYSRTSLRPSLSYDLAMTFAAQPKYLMTTALPHVWGGGAGFPGLSAPWTGGASGGPIENYHEVSTHVGIAVLALVVIGLIAHRRDRRVIALAVVAVWGLLLAVAPSTPFGHLVYDVVPGASLFRGWARNLVLVDLAAAWIAGAGMSALVRNPSRWTKRSLFVALPVVIFIIVLPLFGDFGGTLVAASDRLVALWLPAAMLLLFVVAAFVMVRSRRVGIGLILAACSISLLVFAIAAPWRNLPWPGQRLGSLQSGDGEPMIVPLDAAGGVDRWVAKGTIIPREIDASTSVIDGTQVINGYEPLTQKDFFLVTGAGPSGAVGGDRMWSPGWMADVLRLTTVVTPGDYTPIQGGWTDRGPLGSTTLHVWDREPRLPDAYVVDRVEFEDLDAIIDRLAEPTTRFRSTVYIEPEERASGSFELRPGTSVLRSAVDGAIGEHGTGRFTVDSDRPAVLVVSTSWLDGWKATVNGRSVPVARANGLTIAVPIDAGSNDVRLTFDPPGFRAGLLIAAVSLIALLTTGVIAARGRRLIVGRRSR